MATDTGDAGGRLFLLCGPAGPAPESWATARRGPYFRNIPEALTLLPALRYISKSWERAWGAHRISIPAWTYMTDSRQSFQTVWGVALVLAGIGVFYRIPQVMPQIRAAGYFPDALGFVRFCFYFLGVALLFGGAKKLIGIHRGKKAPSAVDSSESNDPPPQ